MRITYICILLYIITVSAQAEATFEWQEQHAEALDNGDLKWAPKPFVFHKGASTRYIDFENGNDNNDGRSSDTAWKHHPWDVYASGKSGTNSGIHTYVFKRGVTYRGTLIASESGEPDNPIRLTSDPSWGTGEATLSGSELVRGWKKGNVHSKIPDSDKVWSTDLDFAPRGLWMVTDKAITKIPLARTPNWTVSDQEDVMSEWYVWEQPKWWEADKHKTKVNGRIMHKGNDTKHITKEADYYTGAYVWTEWGILIGTPFPTKVEAVVDGGLAFQGIWLRDNRKIITGNRYFLEDKPHYLDSAGEFWFEKNNNGGGRLYLRLPGDVDPSSVKIEAAKRYSIIEDTASAKAPVRLDVLGDKRNDSKTVSTAGVSHVEISGLGFQFNNIWWDLDYPAWRHNQVDSAAIRLRGSSNDIRISHCHFAHVSDGVQIVPINRNAHNGILTVSDSVFEFTGDNAITIGKGHTGLQRHGSVQHVNILRNKMHMIGMRPNRQSHGHAVIISFPVTMHVAGNMLTRTYGIGLFLHGGKESGSRGEAPLSRHLVHHNKVDQSLLAANDYGGIETWQGGPFYIYSNISANPGGLWWKRTKNPEFGARLGMAYYLDGSFKNYLFNNIAWGANNDKHSTAANAVAFYEAVPTIHNSFMNNTIYRFQSGTSWSPRGGYHRYAGNLWSDITDKVYEHRKLKEDIGTSLVEYPHETMTYGPDVFHAIKGTFGSIENLSPVEEKNIKYFVTMEEAVKRNRTINANLGTLTNKQPMLDPPNRDMRLTANSDAISKGVKHFVPWSLYGTVAEWNFYHDGKSVHKILDEHWYMNDYLANRDTYYQAPQYPLEVINVTEENYVKGPLEDWVKGALALNGKDQYAVLKHANIDKPFTYNHRNKEITVEGVELKNADIYDSNFLIEMYLKTKAGVTNGILVKKMDDIGYSLSLNNNGGVTFNIRGKESVSLDSRGKINDGNWHHVIAEANRDTKTITIYIDGTRDSTGKGIGFVSLHNTADLFVGGSKNGDFLPGTIEFARISLGTIADAHTSIEELFTWQFDGPQHYDFLGKKPNGKRDAGALEFSK